MKRIKKFLLSFISAILIATMFTSNLNALDINSEFIQNVNTANTFGYVNYETGFRMDFMGGRKFSRV